MALDGLADQLELGVRFQSQFVRQRQRCGALGQLAEPRAASRRCVADQSLGDLAFGRGHPPGLGGSGHQHRTCARAGLAHRQPQVLDARRAACGHQPDLAHGLGCQPTGAALDPALVVGMEGQALDHGGQVVVDRVDRRVFGANPRPVGVELVSQQHCQRGVDALAHLAFGHHHRDEVVAANLDPAVEALLALRDRQLGAAGQALARRQQAPAQHQRAADA